MGRPEDKGRSDQGRAHGAAEIFRRRLAVNLAEKANAARREGAGDEYIESLERSSRRILRSCWPAAAE